MCKKHRWRSWNTSWSLNMENLQHLFVSVPLQCQQGYDRNHPTKTSGTPLQLLDLRRVKAKSAPPRRNRDSSKTGSFEGRMMCFWVQLHLKDALGHDRSQLDVQEAIPGAGIQCWVSWAVEMMSLGRCSKFRSLIESRLELGSECWGLWSYLLKPLNKNRLGFGFLSNRCPRSLCRALRIFSRAPPRSWLQGVRQCRTTSSTATYIGTLGPLKHQDFWYL